MITCYTCRDVGISGGCEECGKEDTPQFTKALEEDLASRRFNIIPSGYSGDMWNAEILRNEKEVPTQTLKIFNAYLDQLDRLYETFKSGKIPRSSAIIISESQMGKTHLGYSCLQLARDRGLNVFPLLDTTELRSMIQFWEQGKESSLAKKLGVTEDDYYGADILFVKVPKDYTRYGSDEFITRLIDTRSRRGQPTFVLSSFDLSDLAPKGRDTVLKDIANKGTHVNRMKFPVIVRFMFIVSNKFGIQL